MRAWLLMKLSGLAFTEELHHFLEDKNAQRRAWREFSPTAQVPVLEDGAVRVWDSLGIALYIGERCPGIWADDAAARAWSYAAAAQMHSGFAALRSQCPFRITPADQAVRVDDALRAELALLDDLWQAGVNRFGGAYLAGARFSAVDAFYAPVALRLQHFHLLGDLSPATQNYAGTVLKHEWVQQWCAG